MNIYHKSAESYRNLYEFIGRNGPHFDGWVPLSPFMMIQEGDTLALVGSPEDIMFEIAKNPQESFELHFRVKPSSRYIGRNAKDIYFAIPDGCLLYRKIIGHIAPLRRGNKYHAKPLPLP